MQLAILNTLHHPVFSNATATLVVRGTMVGTRLIVVFVTAHFIPPAEFGVVALVLAVVEIAGVVADFGVDTLAIRDFAIIQDRQQQKVLASTILVTKLICGTIAYTGIVLFFLLSLPTPQAEIGAVLGTLVITGLLAKLFLAYYQARLQVRRIVLPIILTNVVAIVAVAILFAIDRTVILGIAILPISEAICVLILSRYFNHDLGFAKARVRLTAILALLRSSLPVAGTSIISMLYTRLDVLILSVFFDVAIIGYYGIAFRITEPFQLVTAALTASMYSHLSATLAIGRQDTRRIVRRYGVGTVAYGLTSCVLLVVFAPIIIRWQLPSYIPAIPILYLLAIAVVFRTLNASLTSVIYAYGRFVWITAAATWNLFLIGVLLWVLVPQLGVLGAPLALLIGEVANTLIQTLMVRRLLARESASLPALEVTVS